MKRGKRAFVLFAGSLLIALSLVVWPSEKACIVEAVRISSGQLTQTVLLKGKVAYSQEHPCIALREGVIAEVYVHQGQPVKAGEMLFRLDTTAEEKTLSSLRYREYQTKISAGEIENALQALSTLKPLEWINAEAELTARIEYSAIRAPADGVMGEINIQRGTYIDQASVLCMVREEKKVIAATALALDAERLDVNSAAYAENGNETIIVRLVRKERMSAESEMMFFEPIEEHALTTWEIGEAVQLDGIVSAETAEALIPLSAFDSENRVWWIENGAAHAGTVEPISCNAQFASVAGEWKNRVVILHPESYGLQEGNYVRVKE